MLKISFAAGCVLALVVGCASKKVTSTPAAAEVKTEVRSAVNEDKSDYGLFPPPMDVLYQNRLQVQSSEFLSIHLFNIPINHEKAESASNFIITSSDDDRYKAAAKVHPTATSSRSRSVRVPDRKTMLVRETAVFLKVPQPLQNGKSYAVTIENIAEGDAKLPHLAPVAFNDRRQTNDNIRVNQLGYLPNHPKSAYLGEYMGSGGDMKFPAQQFELLDASGKSTFKGAIKPRGVRDELVGQTVYELDFTSFNTPGNYRIFVPGVGLSYRFDIGSKAITPAFVNLMRGSFHQRCGHGVDAEYSRHHRLACHLDDAYVNEKSTTLGFVKPKNKAPLYLTEFGDRHQQAIHGHHDAGDYGKYTTNGAGYVYSILQAMEMFPEKFRHDNLGFPFSGNGIPDFIDECKWELDWLENMQDTDGGVFGVIRPNNGGYENSMPPAKAHRFFFPKDTVFAGSFAGALARAARSPLVKQYFPKDAERYQEKAIKAWQWLEKNHTYVQYFHYGQEFGDWDERNWAAIELYAATGDEKYHRYFLQNFDPNRRRWDWWGLFEASGYATNSYAFLKDRKRDDAMLKRTQQAIRDACDKHVRESKAFPYRLSMPSESMNHKSYGWYFPASTFGYDLLCGYALDGKKEYLDTIIHNLDYTFGANPFGYFLQSGLGAKRNIEVVDNESTFDNIIEPVPGIPLGIGSPGFYWLARYERKPAEGQYPSEWPLMNRWFDGFNVSTEFTIEILIREALVTGFFADLGEGAAKLPTVKITADKVEGTAPLQVKFNVEASSPNGRIREYFWDFDDESFSTSSAPHHVFDEPGREYSVAVTVTDEDGQQFYDVVRVACTEEVGNHPRAEFATNKDTIALYHFNGDLKDSSGNGYDLQSKPSGNDRKPYQFTDLAPLWMEKPSGKAVIMDGKEQLTVTIPAANLPASGTPITIEAMLYLREFAGWGYDGNPTLLGLTRDWDDWIGWKQETWDKANAPFFGSGAGRIVNSDKFAADFPRNRWTHVKIVDDGKGKAQFFANGELIGEAASKTLMGEKRGNLVLSIGPFRGQVDEVRVSATAR